MQDSIKEIKPLEPVFCAVCGRVSPYRLELSVDCFEDKGVTIVYNRTAAMCTGCGKEVFVPWVADINVETRRKAVEYAERYRRKG